MAHHARTLIALMALAWTFGQLAEPSHEPRHVATPGVSQRLPSGARATPLPVPMPAVDAPGIYSSDEAISVRIEAAIARFEQAGLHMVPLRIYVHASPEGCAGAPGVFNSDHSGTRIDVCTDDRFVIRHELAHAWEHHKVRDEMRATFMARTGSPVWNDGSVPRQDRAIELAANVIAWGLAETPLSATHQHEFAYFLELFELLTGQPSPRVIETAAPGAGLAAGALTRPALGPLLREELERPPLPPPLEPATAEPGITIAASTPEQEELARKALAKFEANGMAIPDERPLRIYFHEPRDYESCGGHAALSTHGSDFEQIDICTSGEFALLHELSHVWASFEMDESDRTELMKLRGLDVWQGAPDWADNASEHSASIIAWGLGDTEIVPTMIGDYDRPSLVEAFALLSGNRTPVFLTAPEDTPDAAGTAASDDDDDTLSLAGAGMSAATAVGTMLPGDEYAVMPTEAVPRPDRADLELATDAAWR